MKKMLISLLSVVYLTGCGLVEESDIESEVIVDPEIVGQAAYDQQSEKLTIKNCSECHGVKLDGKLGPPLDDVGSEMTPEQIKDAIVNGIGTMPKQDLSEKEANAITDWLSKQKKMYDE